MHFIVWGGLHGVLLSVERAATGGIPLGTERPFRKRILRNLLVFPLIVLTWIPFRAGSVAAAMRVLAGMFSGPADALTYGQALAFTGMAAAWIWQLVAQVMPLREVFLATPLYTRAIIYALSVIVIAIANSDQPQAFIYFRF